MNKALKILLVIAVVLGVFAALGPFYRLEEGTQAVLTRFGKLVDTQTTTGLKFKMPITDNVTRYSKRILSWDGDPKRLPTLEKQFIWIDTSARWKISNPAQFYESVISMEQAYARLDDVIDSAVRTVVSRNPLSEAVRNSNIIISIQKDKSTTLNNLPDSEDTDGLRNMTEIEQSFEEIEMGRQQLSEKMLKLSSKLTPQYGIELIDIVIRQIRYSDDLTASVYNRMIKERNQIAQAYRSFGEGKKAEWLGKLTREKKTILSEAYSKSEEIKGRADALAAQIYADAYSQDEEFYEFWKAMQAYKQNMKQFNKTLTTDMDFFKYLHNPNGR